jgi:hypothetical protein
MQQLFLTHTMTLPVVMTPEYWSVNDAMESLTKAYESEFIRQDSRLRKRENRDQLEKPRALCVNSRTKVGCIIVTNKTLPTLWHAKQLYARQSTICHTPLPLQDLIEILILIFYQSKLTRQMASKLNYCASKMRSTPSTL